MTFSGLTNLIMFDLCNNKLESIDAQVFTGLTELQIIYLFYNRITSIAPLTFKGLINQMSHNQIALIESKTFTLNIYFSFNYEYYYQS